MHLSEARVRKTCSAQSTEAWNQYLYIFSSQFCNLDASEWKLDFPSDYLKRKQKYARYFIISLDKALKYANIIQGNRLIPHKAMKYMQITGLECKITSYGLGHLLRAISIS